MGFTSQFSHALFDLNCEIINARFTMAHATTAEVRQQLINTLTRLGKAPGFIQQCVDDFDGGIKGYRPECNTPLFKGR